MKGLISILFCIFALLAICFGASQDKSFIKNIANESCGFTSFPEANRKHTTVVGYNIFSMKYKLQRMGSSGRMLTPAQDLSIKKKYLTGESMADIERKYGLTEKIVRNSLKRTGVHKRTKSESKLLYYKTKEGIARGIKHGEQIRKYRANDNFFSKPLNKISAYVFGFWIADGHIEKNNKNLLSFPQKEKNILVKIKRAIGATNPINYDGVRGYCLEISSRKLCNDIRALCNFDLSKKKSLVADYPVISKKLDSHFIRGVFDGDGGIWCNKSGQLVFSITGTMSLNSKIQDKLIKNCSVGKTKISNKGNFSELIYVGNKQVIRILGWLYNDATIYLDRKKKIYDSIIKKSK